MSATGSFKATTVTVTCISLFRQINAGRNGLNKTTVNCHKYCSGGKRVLHNIYSKKAALVKIRLPSIKKIVHEWVFSGCTAGNQFWVSTRTSNYSHTKGQFRVLHQPAMHVFDMWGKKNGAPGKKPRRHGENEQKLHTGRPEA